MAEEKNRSDKEGLKNNLLFGQERENDEREREVIPKEFNIFNHSLRTYYACDSAQSHVEYSREIDGQFVVNDDIGIRYQLNNPASGTGTGKGGSSSTQNRSIQDWLNYATRLETNVMRRCGVPNCGSVEATKQVDLTGLLPDVLIFQLNRGLYIPNIGASKDKTNVDFPIQGLNMKKYSKAHGGGGEGDDSSVYDLLAFCMHSGETMQEGHYTACATDDNGVTWRHYNDSVVHVINKQNLEEFKLSAYLLFYKKRGVAW